MFLTKASSGDTILSFRLVHPDHDRLSALPPSEAKVNRDQYECFTKENVNYWVDKNIELDIQDLKDAKIKIMWRDSNSKQWEYLEVSEETYPSFVFKPSSKPCLVDIYFSKNGQKKMAILSEKNIGRWLAIIFQGKLLMAPLIREKIDGAYVTVLSFSFDEATLLKDAITRSSNK
jgi:preprotein translocase subunit SecD